MSEEEFALYQDNDALEKGRDYLCIMLIIKNMLYKGIITADDYLKAEKWVADKYGIPEKSIFRIGNVITSKIDDE